MHARNTPSVWLFAALALAGCATHSGGSYPARAGTVYDVQPGEVVSTRKTEIAGTTNGLGRLVGSSVGVAAAVGGGSTIDRVVRTSQIGRAAGVLAGDAIERRARTQEGLEITVRLANGSQVVIIQEAEPMFAAGDQVSVLFGRNGTARVTAR